MSARSLVLLALIPITGLTAEARVRAQEPAGAPADAEIAMAPVEVDGVVILRVRGVSSFPAGVRARRIQERIVEVAADQNIPADSVRVVDAPGVSRILAGDVTLMSVVDADATVELVGRSDLATVHALRIRQAIVDYRAARTAGVLWRNAIDTLAATLVLVAAIVAGSWVWRLFDRLYAKRLRARIDAVELKSFELMRAERIWEAVRGALLAIRTLIVLAIVIVYIGFVLSQFPWTHGLSRDMVGFALGPLEVIGQGIIAHIPSLVFLTVLFFVFRFLLRLIRLFFEGVERGSIRLGNFEPEWAQPTYKIMRVAIVAFGLIVAYPYIPGSESAAFRGVSLFIGVVFSLGSSSAISNIIAGYMLTYRRAFRLGDRIKVGGAVGEVIAIRLQVTHLRSPKNEELIIPNSQILAGEVLNYSSLARERGLILHTEVGIGYETPWRQVEGMLIQAAERTPGLSKEPPPFVLLKKLGDFAVIYELNAYCTDVPSMIRLYAELHRQILDVFNEYGVQIMTPAYEGDPAEPKIVPPQNWYSAPATPPRGGPDQTASS